MLLVLKPGGLLVTSHFSWLPRLDPIANATEKLIQKHNPAWAANDFSGEIPNAPYWAEECFDIRAMMFFDEDISFTHESWFGRIRACRGVGAALSLEEVEQFNSEHMELLKNLTPDHFTVRHRIDFHILKPKPAQA